MRLVHAIVWTVVDCDCDLAPRRFGSVHFTRSFKYARDLDTEVTQCVRAVVRRALVEKNVVAISP